MLRIVFPLACTGCGSGSWPFCPACHGSLVAFAPPWCERCGVPSDRPRARCRDCPPAEIDVVRSAFLFDGAARAAVHRLKFSGWRPVAAALGRAMAGLLHQLDVLDGDAALTWVPLSRRRRARRGFDQARLLAEAIAAERGTRAVRLLVRVADPPPQARRAGAERRTALERLFVPVGTSPERVILVDDVVTTGGTAAACAAALRSAGARHVALVTAARSVSAPMPRRYTRRGLAPGAVVAREGGLSVVDASRRRNDPRKATLGR